MNKEAKQKRTARTYIGGQAVLEGVMMRGRCAMATAVRDPHGKIQVESERLTPPEKRNKFLRLPFVRGVVSFISSLTVGNKVLMRSAAVAEEEDETPSKAEKWLTEKHKINLNSIFNFISVFLGIVLAVGLFVALPQAVTRWTKLDPQTDGGIWFNLAEGGIRIAIFILYLAAISLIPSLKRVFMCHGAEHKTITAYERGLELTPENVRGCSCVHDRCGTTFLFLVMAVSILVFSLANSLLGGSIYTGNEKLDYLIRFCFKLLLLPFVAGISYEILRALAKTDNKFFLIFKAPGLLLQRLTTREPEDGMIECAIAAFNRVLLMDADETVPETSFAVAGEMSKLLAVIKKRFARAGIEEDEAEWIFALSLGMQKSAVDSEERLLKSEQVRDILNVADERLTGRPLWYIIGNTDFYGYELNVDERVLIPRPETEGLTRLALACAENGDKALDLCTGSGAIAIALKKESEKKGLALQVTAADISEGALEVARANAEKCGADVRFVHSDLFARLRGRFNLIVSNPPYIPTDVIPTLQREVKDHEPLLALDGGKDGLDFYRRIASEAGKYMEKGGSLFMEVGENEAQAVVKLFKYCDYSMILKDDFGKDRYVKIVF
ncbi:MAG: peptide chain release factor N(5)-glutamine methyltransferase [Candidatus Borkfalkiaceae bacterium]|nr:peptide chain release factor N(5)-glutamine methyltransferase [Clostridia bacterium]MDY6222979.1 peptide chain release factor N(5)-glutamine methyltransferase [Christensenellaceae bacterium]